MTLTATAAYWPRLVTPQFRGEVSTMDIATKTTGGSVRVGLDSDGRRHLLIPAGDQPVIGDEKSRGVVLVEQRLTLGGSEVIFGDLVCVDPALEFVFTELAEDICRRLAESPDDAIEVLTSTLGEWRELLRTSRSGVDRPVLIGLRGELELLRRIAEGSPIDALGCWRGPEAGVFDFQRGTLTVEVKTTTAQDGNLIYVHGLRQIDPPDGHDLHIALVRLQGDELGESVPMLIEDLVTLGINRADLEDKLGGLGYRPEDAEHWSERFVTMSINMWRIGPGFPGLRASQLDVSTLAGITEVSYALNLDAGGPSLELKAELKVMSRLAGLP